MTTPPAAASLRLSAIIPVYNETPMVAEAIERLRTAPASPAGTLRQAPESTATSGR